MRELTEESGLQAGDVSDPRDIATYTFYKSFNQQYQCRHVFWLHVNRELPEGWEHAVTGSGEDAGLRFGFEWLSLDDAGDVLAARLGDKLSVLQGILDNAGSRRRGPVPGTTAAPASPVRET